MNAPGTFICDHCGELQPLGECTFFDGQHLCLNCLSEQTTFCVRCGDRVWTDVNAGTDSTPLCQSCYDTHYTHCTRCGALIDFSDCRYPYNDDDPYCPNCSRAVPERIHDYSFKPIPIFYGQGPRYFGVELEIDMAGEDFDNARQLLDVANCDHPLIYCKHDGSLDDGFEIVTHPMSLEFHQYSMPWAKILREATSMGYTSHQAKTCGLHVHVSRDAFGEYESEQDEVIARILYFFERFWEELLRFSRRTPSQLERWAAWYGYKDRPGAILDHAKRHKPNGRYACVNLTNEDTIEFRIFRGTLKLNTLIATLQLVDKVCDVAIALSDDELQHVGWTEFVSGCTQPELVQYLKERRLYVNEPVESEVEI